MTASVTSVIYPRVVPGMAEPAIAHVRNSGGVQPLEDHLRGVAHLASQFAEKVGLGAAGEVVGLLHDLGKYSSEFQAYLKSAVGLLQQDEDEDFVDAARLKGRVDHSSAGAQLIWSDLSAQGKMGTIAGQILALCVASHHSGMIDCLSSDTSSLGEDIFSRRMGKAEGRTHLREVVARASESILGRYSRIMADPSSLIESFQTSFSRIVAGSEDRNDKGYIAQQQFGLLVRLLFSCLIDADRIDSADFESPNVASERQRGRYSGWDVLTDRLDEHLRSMERRDPIDEHRAQISAHCLRRATAAKGIFTLTVPTGGGKTLSSLRFAIHHAKHHGLERIFYFVPFTTIIDQNARTIRRILEPNGSGTNRDRIVLEHHSNLTPARQGWREKLLCENWDAPIVFTTTVQLLESLFGAGTRGARRMHQLANSVLIFDEIQALPLKCVHLFNNAINFLAQQCGSTVLLCTATQPLLASVCSQKGAIRLAPEPELMPDVGALFDDLKRVQVLPQNRPGGWMLDDIAALGVEQVAEAASCLIVVNTKEAARKLYQISRALDSCTVFHLSTSMCPAHRRQVFDRVADRLAKQSPVLCVSTQLIEAGVDLDFGSVIRFEAGLDSIAQAAGRCNRHGRRPMGSVFVVNPRGESLRGLREIEIGRDKAQRVLADYANDPEHFDANPIGPKAMSWFYENYFLAREKDMTYPVSASVLGHDDTLLNLLSTNSQAVRQHERRRGQAPPFYLRQSFMAAARAFEAIDAPTRGVVVPHEDGRALIAELQGARSIAEHFGALERAQQYTVSLFPHVLAGLQAGGAVQAIHDDLQILYLDERYYSPEFGVVSEPLAPMETLIA